MRGSTILIAILLLLVGCEEAYDDLPTYTGKITEANCNDEYRLEFDSDITLDDSYKFDLRAEQCENLLTGSTIKVSYNHLFHIKKIKLVTQEAK